MTKAFALAFLLPVLLSGAPLHAQISPDTNAPSSTAPPSTGPIINVRDSGAKGDGVTDDLPAINDAVQKAKDAGPGANLYFPAGTYLLGSGHIQINGTNGLTMYGDGPTSVLLATMGNVEIVTVRGSKNFTARKLTLDRSMYYFTQGKIDSVDHASNSCTVTLEPGYPDFDAPQMAACLDFKPFTYPDSHTYQQDHYAPAMKSRDKISDRQWMLHMSGDVDDAWVGKEFISWASTQGHAFVAQDDTDLLFEDIDYYARGANAGFYIGNSDGTITIRRFNIDIPPGTQDLLSSGGGGQWGNVRGKLIFDHCKFLKFDDDGADILTNYIRILAQPQPNTLLLQSDSFFHVGDNLAIVNWPTKTERGSSTITQVDKQPGGNVTVTLDHDVTVGNMGPGTGSPVGRPQVADGVDRAVDYNNVTSSTEFHDCEFQCLRARPLNLKAQNCLVDHCTFHDCEMPAIAAGPEMYWEEAPAIHHLTVRNCTFTNCDASNIDVDLFGATTEANGGTATESYDNQDILIEGNTFQGYGAHAMYYNYLVGPAVHVRYATNVTIQNNTFGDPAPTAPPDAPKVVIQHSKNVTIQNNQGLLDSQVKQE